MVEDGRSGSAVVGEEGNREIRRKIDVATVLRRVRRYVGVLLVDVKPGEKAMREVSSGRRAGLKQ